MELESLIGKVGIGTLLISTSYVIAFGLSLHRSRIPSGPSSRFCVPKGVQSYSHANSRVILRTEQVVFVAQCRYALNKRQ